MDGVDRMTGTMDKVIANMGELDRLMPEMLAQVPPMITTMENMQQMMLTTYATMSGMWNQIDELSQNSTRDGEGLRRCQERRLLLPAAGCVRQS